MRALLISFCFITFSITFMSMRSDAVEFVNGGKWVPNSGIKIENKNGAGGYHFSGFQAGNWAYARLTLPDVLPDKGAKYRVEALVKVNHVSSTALPPFLKIVAYRNKDFVKSYKTQKYSLRSKGQWQKLWREFEVESSDLTYKLAIEKGTNAAISVDLEIKDLKFSKISSFEKLDNPLSSGLKKSAIASQLTACQHPCLHLNKTKLAKLKQQISHKGYSKFWKSVVRKADIYSLQQPPVDISKMSEPSIRAIGNRLPYMALAFLITGDQRYLDGNRRWVKAILSYENWASNEDIGAAHLIYGLAISYDWLYQTLSESEKRAIAERVEKNTNILARILVAGNVGWTRSYLNNHNYVNAMAIGVAGRAFQGENADASTWAQVAESNFKQVLGALSPDGASHEGVGYWSYGLDALLKYYDAAANERTRESFRQSEYLKNASLYRLYMSLPGYVQNVDYADSPREDYFGPGYLLRKLATMFGNGRAQWMADTIEIARAEKQLSWLNLLWFDDSLEQQAPLDLPLIHHFSNLGIVVSRSSWSTSASWIFYKAGDPQGKYAKSLGFYEGGHIHPDAGNVLLWTNGNWVLQDDGYTALKSTKLHNVLTFNGYGQLGEGNKMFDQSGFVDDSSTASISRVNFSGDFNAVESYIEKMYPPTAGVKKWKRTLFWLDSYLIVHDSLNVSSAVDIKKYFHLGDGTMSQSGSAYKFQSSNDAKVCVYSAGSAGARSSYGYVRKKNYKVPEIHEHRDSRRVVFTSTIDGENESHTTIFDTSPSKNCNKSIAVDEGYIRVSDKSEILTCGLDSLECTLGTRPRIIPVLRVD